MSTTILTQSVAQSIVNTPVAITFLPNSFTSYATGGQKEYFAVTSLIFSARQIMLTKAPTNPHLTHLFLNGVCQRFGLDYNIDASVVNFLSPMSLGVDWEIEIYYF